MTERSDADRLLDAALMHVPFDGWSEATLRAACQDTDIPMEVARQHYPRGAVDMAFAYHKRGDVAMVSAIAERDMTGLRFRDRIALAVRLRLEGADRELVRRGMTLFALPQNMADGSRALWETAGLIWETLGDTSQDVNWYTKRATLSAVYSSTVLYWLGDESEGSAATWEFLDRRIDNVMKIEEVKGRVRGTKIWESVMAGPPGKLLDMIRAPGAPRPGYPGRWDR